MTITQIGADVPADQTILNRRVSSMSCCSHSMYGVPPVCGELLIFDTNQQFATHSLSARQSLIEHSAGKQHFVQG